MVRIKRGNTSKNRHKKILSLASGYKGAHSSAFRVANQQVMKSLRYAYADRKKKKRFFRSIWITRINAACKLNNISYSRFLCKLKNVNININRKILSQIALLDFTTFSEIVKIAVKL